MPNYRISFLILLVLFVFMLLQLFGALSVPLWVFAVWLAVGLVIAAFGK